MQNNRRKKRANEFVISIAMHLALFALLIWSSLYQTVEIMGGGEGEGDAMGAVMVDTGQRICSYGSAGGKGGGKCSLRGALRIL